MSPSVAIVVGVMAALASLIAYHLGRASKQAAHLRRWEELQKEIDALIEKQREVERMAFERIGTARKLIDKSFEEARVQPASIAEARDLLREAERQWGAL